MSEQTSTDHHTDDAARPRRLAARLALAVLAIVGSLYCGEDDRR